MAKFYAISEADTVGSDTDLVPVPSDFDDLPGTTTAFFVLNLPTELNIFNTDTPLAPTSNITSWAQFKLGSPPAFGGGEVEQVWKADSGDNYAILDAISMLTTPGPVPGFTASIEQDVNQFWFEFDDRIHGSEFDDMLCGWAGKDKMWGSEGDDDYFYGKGMSRDKIMDFEKGEDLYIDDSIANKFKKLKKMAKYNEKKDLTKIKAGDGDVLKVYGIDTKKELKQAVVFDDFTDFA